MMRRASGPRHVPAPWTVNTVNTQNGLGLFVWHEYSEGEGGIDEVCEIVMDYVGNIPEANANLIAAAPELLAACIAIAEFWDRAESESRTPRLRPDAMIGGHQGESPISIHDVLKSVVKKATRCR